MREISGGKINVRGLSGSSFRLYGDSWHFMAIEKNNALKTTHFFMME
jgi:hypothetical protein